MSRKKKCLFRMSLERLNEWLMRPGIRIVSPEHRANALREGEITRAYYDIAKDAVLFKVEGPNAFETPEACEMVEVDPRLEETDVDSWTDDQLRTMLEHEVLGPQLRRLSERVTALQMQETVIAAARRGGKTQTLLEIVKLEENERRWMEEHGRSIASGAPVPALTAASEGPEASPFYERTVRDIEHQLRRQGLLVEDWPPEPKRLTWRDFGLDGQAQEGQPCFWIQPNRWSHPIQISAPWGERYELGSKETLRVEWRLKDGEPWIDAVKLEHADGSVLPAMPIMRPSDVVRVPQNERPAEVPDGDF